MNTERFKMLLESTMGNVKPIVENNRTILKEEANTNLLNQKLERYVKAVKSSIPGYETSVGLEQKPEGGSIFGQLIYSLPLQFPKDQSKVLSNLQIARNRILGVGDKAKMMYNTCVPKINDSFTTFSNPPCDSFNTQLTPDKISKYKEMNAAYNDLYSFLTTPPTQK